MGECRLENLLMVDITELRLTLRVSHRFFIAVHISFTFFFFSFWDGVLLHNPRLTLNFQSSCLRLSEPVNAGNPPITFPFHPMALTLATWHKKQDVGQEARMFLILPTLHRHNWLTFIELFVRSNEKCSRFSLSTTYLSIIIVTYNTQSSKIIKFKATEINKSYVFKFVIKICTILFCPAQETNVSGVPMWYRLLANYSLNAITSYQPNCCLCATNPSFTLKWP